MKKALMTAALLATAAMTPCFTSVLGAIDIPSRASDLACAVASPVFWHIYDDVLTRTLARIASDTAQPAAQRPSQADVFVCLFVQVVLSRAFDGSLTAAQKSEVVSIPTHLIRRVVERRFTAAPKISVPMRHS
jgi:hypothetical protein